MVMVLALSTLSHHRGEHVFARLPRAMGDHGHAYPRFRRALLTKNLSLVDAAARDLRHVDLADALRILVLIAEQRDARFPRAAARWAARATSELGLDLDQSRHLLALVDALPEAPEVMAEHVRSVVQRSGR